MAVAQKTWVELVGKRQDGDYVDGKDWVRTGKGKHRRVLWTFDSEEQARLAFHWWWWESAAVRS